MESNSRSSLSEISRPNALRDDGQPERASLVILSVSEGSGQYLQVT